MGLSVGGGKGSMSEPNIVPLIDVLLVLIIIFMVITPMTPQGLPALVPQPITDLPHTVQPPDTVVVQVTADGKVRINQDDVTWDGLGPRLDDIFKLRAEKAAFVKGDDTVAFMQVARAIDIMRGSGINDVGLITAKIAAGR
ncbi:MAG: biopolymer transporter ExbD [Candidatus Acidiferrales bacterium]